MKTLLLLIFILLQSSNIYSQVGQKTLRLKEINRFQISDKILIGNVSYFAVYKDSLALLVDQQTQKFLLLNLNKNKIYDIDPNRCFPGFDTKPINGIFLEQSRKIFLQNSTISSHILNLDGSCSDLRSYDKYTPVFVNHITAGYAYPMHKFEFELYDLSTSYIHHLDETGRTVSRIKLSNIEYPKLTNRFDGGGIVAGKNNKIYLSTAGSISIRVVDLMDNSIKIRKGKLPPGIPSLPTKDLDVSNPMNLMKSFSEVVRNKSMNVSMHLLNDSTIIQQLQYFENDQQKFVYLIFDINKEIYVNHVITDKRLYYAANNFIYSIKHQDESGSDQINNPSLIIYEMIF
jgi:hypothetical protein